MTPKVGGKSFRLGVKNQFEQWLCSAARLQNFQHFFAFK